MSSHQESPPQRRTSERRRLKMMRRTNEYRVPNPFRNPQPLPFPHSLFHQLRRIEFLSASAIAQLCFDGHTPDPDCGEGMLSRMHEAVLLQELRYSALLGPGCLSHPQGSTEE